MSNRYVRAVSFDLDDTLWPCDDVIARAEARLYAWLQRECPRICARYSLEAMATVREETARRYPHLAHDLTRLRHAAMRQHAREAGYGEDIAEHAVEVFLRARNEVALYDDALPVLEELACRYPLIALTNGNADIRRIGRLGQYFVDSLSAAEAGAAKPDPAMFRLACRRLGVRSGELLHVGDDPLRDVHAARATGARAVWLNRSGMPWPDSLRRGHHEVRRLDQLPLLLADGKPGG